MSDIKDERFTSGFVCPHCRCVDHITRNGHIIKTDKDGNNRNLLSNRSKML